MNLIDLYTSILKTANLICSDDGFISVQIADTTQPAMLKGKRLVLPLPMHLSNAKKDDIVIFHPLSEHISRGESDVLEKFRSMLNIRLNYTIGILGYQLLLIAASTGEHAKLNPDQSEFLSKVKNADEKTIETFAKLMAAMPTSQTVKCFTSIYLKRGAMLHDKKYPRAGIVGFPLYKELTTTEGDVFGVKVRVKDRATFISLLEYMFPMIAEPNAYSYGTISEVAPFLHALMQTVLKLASPLNDLLVLFQNKMEGSEELLFEDEWVETFENLGVMVPEIRKIPTQNGNEGAVINAAGQPVPSTAPTTAVTVPLQGNVPVAPWAPPIQQQSHQFNQFQQQQQFNQQPINNGPIRTQNGLDFNSILRSNPTVAAAAGVMSGGHQMYPGNVGNGRASLSNPVSNQQQGGWGQNNNNGGWNNNGGGLGRL
jgi:hypothetical protein